jgi:diaminopimelate decarboxylase
LNIKEYIKENDPNRKSYQIVNYVSERNVNYESAGKFKEIIIRDEHLKEHGLSVHICSRDNDAGPFNKYSHSDLNEFVNRKIKITIETVD